MTSSTDSHPTPERLRRGWAVLALVALLSTTSTTAQTVGAPLPPWTPGMLDIHQINTGRGNSALLIFPDGTSLLVDAGADNVEPPRGATRVPDGSRTPGEWIARYARRMLVHDAEPVLDYGMVTHFHSDHMGRIYPDSKTSATGAYKLTGFTDVAEHLPIRTMIDRGWPDYDYPAPLDDELMQNYRAFLDDRSARGEMQVERLEPGRSDQIVLRRAPERYPTFEVRNIAANGEVWTGVGTAARRHFPPLDATPEEDWPTENQSSLAIWVSYGRFDYYTGGDLPGHPRPGYPDWQDVETPVAQAVGPVDVAVLNHHGNRDSTNVFFVSTLQPRVWIIPARMADHPGHDVIDRMYSTRLYPGPRDVFSINMIDANKMVIGELLTRLQSDQGHIVIRVVDGGKQYRVIILDDAAENFHVKAVHGPYEAR